MLRRNVRFGREKLLTYTLARDQSEHYKPAAADIACSRFSSRLGASAARAGQLRRGHEALAAFSTHCDGAKVEAGKPARTALR
jgi:hypothetical protein